jgi:hypothetical protein
MLLMLLEDAEKNTLIRECQMIVLSFLLTLTSERWEYCMECGG